MMNRHRGIRIRYLVLSLVFVAMLACTAVFLTASAAEDDDQETVSSTDDSSLQVERGEDGKLCLNRPEAVYTTSYKEQMTECELVFYNKLYDITLVKQKKGTYYVDVSRFRILKSDDDFLFATLFSAEYALSYDYPEAFWHRIVSLNNVCNGEFIKGVNVEITEGYAGALNDRSTVQKGIDTAVSRIKTKRASSSRYDTVKAIHDYICDNTTYDYGATSGDAAFASTSISPFFGGGKRGSKLVCEGYSKVFKLLCKKFNIPAVVVTGMGHAWNYVQMEDGKWYGIDTTWDDVSDTSPPGYTNFLGGSERGGPRYFYDHKPDGDMINSGGIVAPAVYPVLAENAYVPDGGFYFCEECNKDEREVSGITRFVWKYKGDISTAKPVKLYFYDKLYGTYTFDSNGMLQVDVDTSKISNGSSSNGSSKVILQSDTYSDYRYIEINNTAFELLTLTDENPTMSGIFDLRIKGYSTGNITECSGLVYIDDQYYCSGNFNSEGLLTLSIDTTRLSNSDHNLAFHYINSWGTIYSIEKNVRVYNSTTSGQLTFWGKSAANGRVVGETVAFTLKYGGTVSSGSQLKVFLNDVNTNVYFLNARNAAEAFDSNGFCTFYLNLKDKQNRTYSVRAELTPNGGTSVSASVNIVVNNGYLVFTNWNEDFKTLYGVTAIKTKKLYEKAGVSCTLTTYMDGKFISSGGLSDGATYNIVNCIEEFNTTRYSDGEHYYSFIFSTTDGRRVEKGKRFRIGNNDPLRFEDAQSINERIFGECAQFSLKYNGTVTNSFSLKTYIDNVLVPAKFLNSSGIASAFDNNGIGKFYVNLNGQSDGTHMLRAVLVRADGSTVEASTSIVVSKGYFSFYNWQGNNPVATTRLAFSLKNTSGINGDSCDIMCLVDDKQIFEGLFGDGINTTDMAVMGYSNGEHLLKIIFKTNTGKVIEKAKLFTVRHSVPAFSINTLGASIRLREPYGIRFGIRINKNADFKNTKIIEYGTLIIPSEQLGNQELNYYTDKVLKIKANNLLENDSTHITYTGVLINIPASNFDTKVKGRGYLIYKDSMGKSWILYSQTVERTFNGVARAAYDQYSLIENPTPEQQEMIDKLKAILKI